MEWYDTIIVIGIVFGMLLAFFGSYHGYGGKAKTGLWGWAMVFFFLIVKALIWIVNIS